MRRVKRLARAVGLGLALLCAGRTVAQERNWHADVEVLTDIPVQVGARLGIQGPFGIRASTSLGVFPAGYVELINQVATATDLYSEKTAELIRTVLENSLVWRTHLGIQPFAGWGFYIDGGYSLVVLGGAIGSEVVLSEISSLLPPPSELIPDRNYEISSTLHMLDLELGWSFLIGQGWVIRTGVGFTGTVAARTRIDPDFVPILSSAVEEFCRQEESSLNHIYTSHVFMPTLSIAIGYRFF